MKNLNPTDCSIVAAYFLILIVIGMMLCKRASLSLEGYFLGGRKIDRRGDELVALKIRTYVTLSMGQEYVEVRG